jgi:hypothetical protein
MARAGIPASEANPHRTQHKMIRMNSVSDLFSSGMVYAPLGRRWVEEVRQEFAEFPNGEFDDLADAGVWGLMRIRQGNLIRLASDETTKSGSRARRGNTTKAIQPSVNFLPQFVLPPATSRHTALSTLTDRWRK